MLITFLAVYFIYVCVCVCTRVVRLKYSTAPGGEGRPVGPTCRSERKYTALEVLVCGLRWKWGNLWLVKTVFPFS